MKGVTARAGAAAGEDGWMCGSHGQQASRKHEARMTGGRVPVPA